MATTMILWTCTFAACPSGRFINDGQGRADHQSSYGHAPVPGRALAWAFDRSAAP
jgi:hypothetical protein